MSFFQFVGIQAVLAGSISAESSLDAAILCGTLSFVGGREIQLDVLVKHGRGGRTLQDSRRNPPRL
jgi:hypothetical protein